MKIYKHLSLTTKITISTAFVMILNAVLVIIVAFLLRNSVTLGVTSKELVKLTNELSDSIVIENQTIHYPENFKFVNENVYYLVLEEDGMVISGRYPVYSGVEIGAPVEGFRQVTLSAGEYYVCDSRIPGSITEETLWVRAVEAKANGDSLTHILFNLLWIITPIFSILAIIFSFLLAKKTMSPINHILKSVNQIDDASDLSARIELSDTDDEIHKLSQSFNDMLARLEASFDKEKQFSSDISHELRTPISVIKAQCDYLINYSDEIDEYKEGIADICEQSQKLQEITESLLSLARLEGEATNILHERLSILPLLDDCYRDIKVKYNDLTINIFPNNMDFQVLGDSSLLKRVFLNLFENVYKYGNKKADVKISSDENKITISVSDYGDGISHEDMGKIWDAFYRANSQNRTGDGYGLGLSLAKRIIEIHSGTITCTNRDIGCEFVINLPSYPL